MLYVENSSEASTAVISVNEPANQQNMPTERMSGTCR